MRRWLVGLAGVLCLLAGALVAAPYVVPVGTLKAQVVAQVEEAAGWRLRLDGPVRISAFPRLSLVAEKVGISGEAGADGIEFARADEVRLDLSWSGLLDGKARLTGVHLVNPDLFLEIGPSGLTSWAPRRQLTPAQEAAAILGVSEPAAGNAAPAAAPATSSAEAPAGSAESLGALSRIGVDLLEIEGGHAVYQDRRSGLRHEISDLDLSLTAPDLDGEATLDSRFAWQGQPVTATGTVDSLLELVRGKGSSVKITATLAEAELGISGAVRVTSPAVNLVVTASGPRLGALASALRGGDASGLPAEAEALANDSFALSAAVKMTGTDLSISNLTGTIGSLGLEGTADAALAEGASRLNGQLRVREGDLADLLRAAGLTMQASGRVAGDLTFAAEAASPQDLGEALKLAGGLKVSNGAIRNLGLADRLGLPSSADAVSDLTLSLDMDGREAPLRLSGSMGWLGESFTLQGESAIAALAAGKAAPTTLRLKGSPFLLGYDGAVSLSGSADGVLVFDTADLRRVLAMLGRPVPAANGLRQFSVRGTFTQEGEALTFRDAGFQVDDTAGTATGRLSLSGKPKLTGELAFDKLVLDPYFSSDGGSSGAAAGKAAAAGAGSPGASAAWSSAPLDLSALTLFDLDLTARVKALSYEGITLDAATLKAGLADGVLTADLSDVSLYKGKGTAQFRVSAASPASISAKLSLADVAARPLLSDAAGMRWLDGRAAITLDVTTQGRSQLELVSALAGSASFSVADGALYGVNIPKMLRGLALETLLGWDSAEEEKTDFSSLTASFALAQGIATNSDLYLEGPLLRMTGAGTTSLPAKTLDWRVEPKVVPTLEGQAPVPRRKGSDKTLAGLGVPIIIKGSWAKPQIYPDLQGILENPEAAYKQLESVGGELAKIVRNGGKVDQDTLADAANQAIDKATNGKVQIDVKKVIEGEADDEEVLKAVEEGLGLPPGLLQGFGFGKKKN